MLAGRACADDAVSVLWTRLQHYEPNMHRDMLDMFVHDGQEVLPMSLRAGITGVPLDSDDRVENVDVYFRKASKGKLITLDHIGDQDA